MRKESLNTKIVILTTSLFVVCSLVYGIFFSYQSKSALMDEFVTRGNSLLKNLALNAEVEILIENREALNTLAENLLQEKDVRSVKIIGDHEQVLVDIAKPGEVRDEYKETMSVYVAKGRDQNISDRFTLAVREKNSGQPERDREERIGYIEAVFSKKGIFDTIDSMRRNMFLAALAATVIGCIIALYYSRSIVKPVRRLASATARIARGDWEANLPIGTMDEVGQLTESFNKMSASLIEKRKELEATYKELSKQERMAEIGNFSMMIAHELKNPLGIIKGAIDIIAKEGVKAEVSRTMMGYIQDEVKRLNRLVEDFLSFARPNPAHKNFVDINHVVNKIVNLIPLPEFKEKEITLTVQLAEDIAEVNVDEHQIYQAIVNIFNNAIQAIPHQGEITVKTESAPNGILITIMDTGVGISEEEREKIFEPFFTKKQSGTGLGLAVVRKIIDNHKGRITITAREGGGTIFSVGLPLNG